jgi:hypothetical protein
VGGEHDKFPRPWLGSWRSSEKSHEDKKEWGHTGPLDLGQGTLHTPESTIFTVTSISATWMFQCCTYSSCKLSCTIVFQVLFLKLIIKNKQIFGRIPRWQLEGGSRKRASYSEILERHWRHTLQAKPPRRGKTLTPPHSSFCRESPLHVKQRNQEGPRAARCPRPDGLGRLGLILFYFMFPLWWDNYRTTSEAPSPGLEAERRTPKLLRLKLHCIGTWSFFYFLFCFILFYLYIYIFFFHLLIFIFILIFILFIFYFQSSLCLSNAFSVYDWLVHCLSLFISLKFFGLSLCFVCLSTWLFVFPFSFNFFAFHPLSPFRSKYH